MSIIDIGEFEPYDEMMFKQILVGQSLRHNCSLKIILGSYSISYLINELKLTGIGGNRDYALKLISDELDKRYIEKYYVDFTKNKKIDYYELVNRITKSGLFLLVAFDDSHKKSLLELGFKEILYDDISLSYVYDYTSDIIYIRPDRLIRLVDIAIYKKVFVSFDKFSFSRCVKKLLKEVPDNVKNEINDRSYLKKFYGFSDAINFGCFEIPLEPFILRSSSNHGYVCVLGDISFNYALMLYLDHIQIRRNPKINYKLIDPSKRLVSFVMSDGDNVSFMAGKIPRLLEMKRDDYPVTWTLSNLSPISYFNNIVDHFYEYDTFITAGSGNGYFYPDVNEELTKTIKNESIINVIEGKFSSLFKKNDYLKNIDSKYIFVVNIINYALNRKSYVTNGKTILTANHQFVFEREINDFVKRVNTEKSMDPLIVMVNINNVNIVKLNEIVSKIRDKVEIVSLQQMISEMNFMTKFS